MYSLPGDPGLPPGVSESMIARRFSGPEDCAACEGTGIIERSLCCDTLLRKDIDGDLWCVCCGKPAEMQKCEACDGTGEERAEE